MMSDEQNKAGNTKLYCRVTSVTDLQAHIDVLVNWSKKWLLPLNSTKCRVMHFGRQNPGHACMPDGEPMQKMREGKDLGILIDDELNVHKQLAAATSKTSQMLAVVRRSFANLDESTLPLLY